MLPPLLPLSLGRHCRKVVLVIEGWQGFTNIVCLLVLGMGELGQWALADGSLGWAGGGVEWLMGPFYFIFFNGVMAL